MNERVIKVGGGLLCGVSNENAQPGKSLRLYDGEIILGHLRLDEAFPAQYDEAGEILSPGIVLNVVFTRELRVSTDGENVEIAWM